MPRSRRVACLAVAGACVAAAATPALAQEVDETTVSYVVEDLGTRTFKVTEVDGTTPLADFTFDSTLQKPFRTIVEDDRKNLLDGGYQVTAQMTNLYRSDGKGGWDHSTAIPSRHLGLTYGADPLAATTTLPVRPQLSLTGTIGTCADSAVASALGLAAPLLGPLDSLGLLSLTPTLRSVCTQLGNLTAQARTVTVTVDGALQTVTAPLGLGDLPVSLTGGVEGGSFTHPSYAGPIAAGAPVPDGAPAATTKRVMTGTPLLTTGADLGGLVSTLTTTLTSQLSATPLVTVDGVFPLSDVVAEISGVAGGLASVLGTLTADQRLTLVNGLTRQLLPVDPALLTTVSGQYSAYPVLTANPLAAAPGVYSGTLIVDFWPTS